MKITNEQAIEQLTRICKKCDNKWVMRTAEEPAVCPKCKNPRWNKDKKA